MFALPETITVWTRTSSDGLGGGAWSDPAQYPARKALKQEKFTDINGDSQVSRAVCYTEAPLLADDLAAGVYVYFGASSAVAPPAAANDVRGLAQTESGAGDLKKLWFA